MLQVHAVVMPRQSIYSLHSLSFELETGYPSLSEPARAAFNFQLELRHLPLHSECAVFVAEHMNRRLIFDDLREPANGFGKVVICFIIIEGRHLAH